MLKTRPHSIAQTCTSAFTGEVPASVCVCGLAGCNHLYDLSLIYTGALPPSGGDVRVMGHSLLAADGLEVAQGVMGVCPQFDVLWDELTGQEHMYIYGCIKGLPASEVSISRVFGGLAHMQVTWCMRHAPVVASTAAADIIP